jgi:co-chaperonin GroES (HSP10)
MKIEPVGNIIYLEIKEAKAGVLDTSSRQSAVEYAQVLAVGSEVKIVKPGDWVFVKAWSVDIINHEDKRFYFVSEDTNGVLAIVK